MANFYLLKTLARETFNSKNTYWSPLEGFAIFLEIMKQSIKYWAYIKLNELNTANTYYEINHLWTM